MKLNLENHPCFNDKVRHTKGRIHLPVAPACNIQCNYCNRKYDCVNESRPGVSSTILTPGQSLWYLEQTMEKGTTDISVVGIAGPGDPFANSDKTMETLRLVREKYPEMLLCVASNGLGILPYVQELAELETSHITLTINTMNPETGAKIYSWVRDGKKIYRGVEGAALLLERQVAAAKAIKEAGMVLKINSIIVPGINEDDVIEVAKAMSEIGADIFNGMPLYQNEGSVFEDIKEPSKETVAKIRLETSRYISQMHHCSRCRADAAGIIGEGTSDEAVDLLTLAGKMPVNPGENRPYVAAASMEGMLINQHLGEAERFLIYEKGEYGVKLVEERQAPEPGCGDARWKKMASILSDCSVVAVSGAGSKPRKILLEEGVQVLVMEGLIGEALNTVFMGEDISSYAKRPTVCGAGCGGTGGGCG
jgi:nitrogen fixation protein NifB